MKALLTILVLCLCAPFAIGATEKHDLMKHFDVLAEGEIKSSGIPSLQIAIGYKDKVVYERAFGFSDLENEVLASTKSKYRTASIAKWFTSTSAMILAESGLLDLDKPIQTYCPHYPKKPWDLTTRQLLTHTAGVRGYVDFDALIKSSDNPHDIEALKHKQLRESLSQHTRYEDVSTPLNLFKEDPLIFRPGSDWSYTSFGYRILACVMEGASSQQFQNLLEDTIFKKSNMKHTVADDAWKIIPYRVSGYRLNRDRTLRRSDSRDISENLAAGGYLSTVGDLVRFALSFNHNLVSVETKDLMVSPVAVEQIDIDSEKSWRDAVPNRSRYGYGVMLWSKYFPGMVGHTGRQAGAASVLILLPDEGLSIAVMTNAKGWNGYLNFVMRLIHIIENGGGISSLDKLVPSNTDKAGISAATLRDERNFFAEGYPIGRVLLTTTQAKK